MLSTFRPAACQESPVFWDQFGNSCATGIQQRVVLDSPENGFQGVGGEKENGARLPHTAEIRALLCPLSLQ